MEVPQQIDKYNIECLVSTLLERRLFIATDPSGTNVVIKESIEDRNQELSKEFEILSTVKHPNILHPIELFNVDDKFYLVMPRAETDLNSYMSSEIISDKTIHKIMQSLFSAVKYLHAMCIWHRNIKLENILIFDNNQEQKFVLSGFSLARNFIGISTDEFFDNISIYGA